MRTIDLPEKIISKQSIVEAILLDAGFAANTTPRRVVNVIDDTTTFPPGHIIKTQFYALGTHIIAAVNETATELIGTYVFEKTTQNSILSISISGQLCSALAVNKYNLLLFSVYIDNNIVCTRTYGNKFLATNTSYEPLSIEVASDIISAGNHSIFLKAAKYTNGATHLSVKSGMTPDLSVKIQEISL